MIKIFDILLFNGIALLLLTFGIVTIINPEIFSTLYGIQLPTGDAVAAIRTIIGGSEVAMGIMFMFRAKLGFTDRSLCVFGALIFIGLIVARTYHFIEYQEVGSQFTREYLAEFLIAILFGFRIQIGFENI